MSPVHAVGLDQGRDGLRVGPDEVRRPEQRGVGLGHRRGSHADAAGHLAGWPDLDGRGLGQHGRRARQRGCHVCVGFVGDDDDRHGAAGPGALDDAPHGRSPGGVGEGVVHGGGEDHGSDGHEADYRRAGATCATIAPPR